MKYVIPILVAALLAYALIRRVNPYEAFIRGAADAVPTLLRVLPALAAMLGAITLLRGCGALDALGNWLSPVFEKTTPFFGNIAGFFTRFSENSSCFPLIRQKSAISEKRISRGYSDHKWTVFP